MAQVLQQAAGVSVSPDVGLDLWDYIVSLREGIVDAWGGIILAFKNTPKGSFRGTNLFLRLIMKQRSS